mmetsp:Transcript_18497/g.46349  ORF Transcript_18497/g.46349 Transcript_18497/m.46349 type:complete len:237 (+) Transcript_18497:29-739(+)
MKHALNTTTHAAHRDSLSALSPPPPIFCCPHRNEGAGLGRAACPLSNSRVAILLRGRAFREVSASHDRRPPSAGCSGSIAANKSQTLASLSLRNHIVAPLEACGNVVEILITECSRPQGCSRFQQLILDLYGSRVVASITRCMTKDQLRSVRMSLDLLKSAADKRNYDMIIITRHDIIWAHPITHWRSFNASSFNFLGGCCINDHGPCCTVCPAEQEPPFRVLISCQDSQRLGHDQ